nr:hypothetical protein [Mesorhizobium loti]
MKKYLLALLAAAIVLMGNQTVRADNRPDFKTGLERCMRGYPSIPISAKEEIRTFMGVSKERAPAVFCQRSAKAIASGRITLSDINRLQESRSTEIWKVIKGR